MQTILAASRHNKNHSPAALVGLALWACAALTAACGPGGQSPPEPGGAGGQATAGGAGGASTGSGSGGRADAGGGMIDAGSRDAGIRDTGATGAGGLAPGAGGSGGGNRGVGGSPAGAGGNPAGVGGNPGAREVFSSCRFHFGTIDSKAKAAGAATIAQLDYFTPGWMLGAAFDHQGVCNDTKPGAVLDGKVPIIVAYVAAGNVKRDHQLCDCNVAGCAAGTLCQSGAQFIAQDWTKILNAYRSYSQGFASCYGTTRPIIFEMEPDWYQYTGTAQTQPWTAAQAGSRMTELVNALKTNLPNARFSMDVSPWVGPSNGSDNGKQWYSNFDMSLFSFVNTSGGGTNANTAKIRSSNNMTWAGLHQVTGKPILADTGYGANGISAGPDPAWDIAANINARIADGVISIAQYNPSGTWGTTITNIRSQLSTPPFCP
jgi:hypothetical protein